MEEIGFISVLDEWEICNHVNRLNPFSRPYLEAHKFFNFFFFYTKVFL